MDALATAGTWSWFVLTLGVFDPVLRVAGMFGDESMDRAVSLMSRSLALSVRAGLGRLRVEGLENAPPGGRMIIVANHQSLAENFLPLWLLDHMRPRYVSKRALGRWIPAVSYNLRRCGHCLIDRDDRGQSLAAIAVLGARVQAGEISALIFPEGTRSATGRLRGFKTAGLRTLLEAAPDAGVLPVVFHGGDRIFPRGRPRVRAFSTLTMRVLPPIATSGREADEILTEVSNGIREAYAELEAREGRGGLDSPEVDAG